MRFEKDKNYKLTEFAGGLVITDAAISLKDATAQPLIIADAGTLLTYLDRYFFEREKGATLAEAHGKALATARITNVVAP